MLKSTGVVKKLAISTAVAGMLLSAPAFANVADAASINTHQILSNGARGQAVKTLQTKLDNLNYYNYNIDGIYGAITTNAVKKFQRTKDLKVDGIAGPKTLGSLFGNSSVHSSNKLLRIGSRGQAVSNLQSKLHSLGYYSYKVDGIYGAITDRAVRSFQRANGLAVDGIAGPGTFGALSGHPKSASSKPVSKHRTHVKSASTHQTSHASNAVSVAKSYLGTPHSVLDCSAFIQKVYNKVGISLPRTANAMWYNAGSRVSSPSPGDLVFFQNTYQTSATATHVGVYIGGGNMISSTSSHGVAITPYNSGYWGSHYLGAKSVD